MIKKTILYFFLSLTLFINRSIAHEGMWIPLFLGELNEAQMKEMGMEISAEDIYSINHSSLKDAIVIFGRGCTGELISDQGLVLTNHHCGYGSIQSHSSIEHDYLTDGFWAKNHEEELPNPGLTVTFLVEMREVTKEVLTGVDEKLSEEERTKLVKENLKKLKESNSMDNGIDVVIKPFFSGNRYFMFFYESYKDVRLVGAPPSNIGKFGGDTDNWMWPRHTGDFSLFRIYANEFNKPAAYSKDNVPYKPKKHLKISLQGVEKDDFTFVYGYPGTTQEYLVSDAVEMITEVENPIRIKLRTIRLDIMKAAQNEDPAVRIQYAGKVASLANGWKKWQGENKGVTRMNAIETKKELEKQLENWVEVNPEMKVKYGNILSEYQKTYAALAPWKLQYQYYREAGMGIEVVKFASTFQKFVNELSKEEPAEAELSMQVEKISEGIDSFFKDYFQPIDEKVTSRLIEEYVKGVYKASLPDVFVSIDKKFKGDYKRYAKHLFDETIFVHRDELEKLIANPNKKTLKKILSDPAFQMAMSLERKKEEISKASDNLSNGIAALDRKYMQMQMDFQPTKVFYPDANFTLRVAYGKVDGYQPLDAVEYNYYTTLEGIMEKENPEIYDYVVEKKLKQLYQNKDYGQYATKEGQMNVCFAASNHTTGGNSGSPVFNSKGDLIGINFDRNWEGTMSDIIYDPQQCRNITLDIRYCLFVIDKFAGASHIIDELSLVR